MKPTRLLLLLFCISVYSSTYSQELDKSTTVSVFAGIMNYQGDVKPDNFTMDHSNLATGITVRKPINRWFSIRAGFNVGKITAADYWNTEDLKPRNLSFTTTIKEAYAGLEITILDISTSRFTPYVYAGLAVFHFNPWTKDDHEVKTYLKPLSTEGQGLSEYPEQKPYNLTQICIPFGGGARFLVTDGLSLGIELNQRKSFTDYIDDVSGSYVDRDVLFQEKGYKAVQLAYRADELPGGRPIFPAHGEKRGTPTEMDWYYFVGLTVEAKLSKIGGVFKFNHGSYTMRCPRRLY